MAFRTGNKRESPWPFHVRMGLTSATLFGYMCGFKDEESRSFVTAATMPGMQASPTEFKYGALSPQVEATFAQTEFHGGYGQRYIRNHSDDLTRYYWTIGVDCSCEGAVQLGPLITVVTPDSDVDSTNGISHFWTQVVGGTTRRTFALNGRYAKVRNDGDAASDWDTSKDFGAGNAATDVVVWAQNTGTGGTTYAFVALGDGAGDFIWRYDGATNSTTWTQSADIQALCFCKGAGNALFRAYSTNLVSKCLGTADPFVLANHVDVARVGDATSPIVRMVLHPDGTLYVFKTDGWYVILEDASVIQLSSNLNFQPNADNGRYQSVFENDIVAVYSGSTYAIGPGGSVRPIGPERMTENNTDVRGRLTASVATPWGLVAGIWSDDADNATSHLLKWGAWRTGDDGISHRLDAWHGAISEQYTSKITALARVTPGAATNHERVYLGFADGRIGHYLLNCVPNPHACSSYRYRSLGYLYTSNFDAHFSVDQKHLHWVAVVVSDGTLNGAVSISSIGYYDDSLLPTAIGGTGEGALGWGGNTTGVAGAYPPGQKTDASTGIDFLSLAWAWAFTTNVSTASPVMTGWGIGFAIRPVVTLAYDLYILCEDGLLANDGHALKIGASQIRTNLFALATTPTDFLLVLPNGGTSGQRVSLWEWEETIAWDPRGQGQWREAIRLRLLQTQPHLTNYGSQSYVLGT
jgi:hypothetical protein